MSSTATDNEMVEDARAVTAIRSGDRERYRELVERHADKVFAIAWARLGDRVLAEEAAQEAFIAGFRRLGLLGKAERFGAWIGTIARHTAINLGMRHRGELQRRTRWALETEAGSEVGPGVERDGDDGQGTLTDPELLRRTLEDLPPGHRECLVLFYLESHSVAESAPLLGISENAFKVRLHRARTALREALEGKLETNLRRLRAPAGLASAVMLGLPTGSGGWLGLSTFGSVIAKLMPFGYVIFALQVVAMLPGLAAAWWIGRRELANFREPEGFRGHFYRRFLRAILLFCAGMVVLAMTLSHGLSGAVIEVAKSLGIELSRIDVGMRPYAILFGLLTLLTTLDQWRRLHCIRHPLNYAASLAMPVFVVMFLSMAVYRDVMALMFFGQGLFFLIMSFGIPKAAPRMDHSLFTRAAHGLLPDGDAGGTPPAPGETDRTNVSAKDDGLEFARFLGRRQMIEDWRRPAGGGLVLRLARVAPNPVLASLPFYWRGASRLILRPGGRVEAGLDVGERRDLAGSLGNPAAVPAPAELEARVVASVERAWRALASGQEAAADRCIGEVSEATIFRTKPERSGAMRTRVWLLRVAAVLMPLFGVKQIWFTDPPELQQVAYKRPVAITEVHVTGFLARLALEGQAGTNAWNQFQYGLTSLEGVPSRSLFPTNALRVVQRRLTETLLDLQPAFPASPGVRAANLLGNRGFMRAVEGGLFSGEELDGLGLGREMLRNGLRNLSPPHTDWLTRLHEYPVQRENYGVLSTRELAARVRYLAVMDSVDLLDLGPVVDELVRCQVRPENSLTNRWPVPDRKEWDGLFVTMSGETLRDTWDVLVILDAAKALDRIDREACVQGILRFHRGKGLFVPHVLTPATMVRGDSRDTWAAYASLRLLGGLGRVEDLKRWEFRPPFPSLETQSQDGSKILPWEQIEAWCLREDFRRERRTAGGR